MRFSSINVNDVEIEAVHVVRDLGVCLDSELKMKHHVSNLAKACYLRIRQLRTIRKYLTTNAAKILVHAFIISKLDYCNSLLFGISEELLDKLQRIQNAAARLITCQKSSEHITPSLKALHWLPIRSRIKYKIALFTFKCLRGTGPIYLSEQIVAKHTRSNLRSSNQQLLEVPKTKLKSAGDRSFRFAAPTVWNALPIQLRTVDSEKMFKKKLKTFLFQLAYEN
jgi:hypothetical protein